MRSNEDKPILKCGNLLISPRGLAETHGRKVAVFVTAADIDRITLKFGRSDHHPALTISIGIVFVAVGIFGLVDFFMAMSGYRYELAMVAFGIIGGSLIFDTLKERYFLEVTKKKGMCRLVFSKDVQRKDANEFCDNIGKIYQYQVTTAI